MARPVLVWSGLCRTWRCPCPSGAISVVFGCCLSTWAASSVFSGFFRASLGLPGPGRNWLKNGLNFCRAKTTQNGRFGGVKHRFRHKSFFGLVRGPRRWPSLYSFSCCLSVLGASGPHHRYFLAFSRFSGSPRAGPKLVKKHCLNFVKQKRPKTNDFRGSNPVTDTSPFLGVSAVLAVGLFLAFFHCLSVLGTSWPHRLNFLAFFGFSGSPRAGPKLV